MCDLAQKLSAQLDAVCTKNSPIPQRLWVYGTEGKAYIRITQRMISPGNIHPTIDLATVEIDEQFQNQGVFKKVLEVVEHKAAQYQRCVFVENVLNEVLIEPLKKYGYTMLEDSCPPSFVKQIAPTARLKM